MTARALSKHFSGSAHGRMMQAVGSAYYVAPEVLVAGEGPNDGGYDETCDVVDGRHRVRTARSLRGVTSRG